MESWNELDKEGQELYENPDEEFFTPKDEYIRIGKKK